MSHRSHHWAILWSMTLACGGICQMVRAEETPPSASTPESFNDEESFRAGWRFSNGAEWPGAKGSMERRDSGGRTGDGVLALKHDFTEGGSYVAALVTLPQDREIKAVRMWLLKPDANHMIVRCVDAKGETFQKDLRYTYPGWQMVEILLGDWVYSWGGDGVFDHPPRQFDILIQPDGGQRVGELLIDDVQWVYDVSAFGRLDIFTSTYRESDFISGDAWRFDGPAKGDLAGRTWTYEFSEERDACGIGYGRSILGRPQKLIVTFESDASGHELTAMCGSHFQYFHTTLGTIDKAGVQRLEVPMGDMRTWRHEGGQDDGMVRYPLRLENMGVRRAGGAAEGRIELQSLEFVTEFETSDSVAIVPTVSQDSDGRVQFRARLRNLLETDVEGKLMYRISSFDRELATGEVTVRLAAAGGDAVKTFDAEYGDATMLEGRFSFVTDEFSTKPVTTTIAKADLSRAETRLNPASRMGVGMYLYRFHKHPEAKEWMTKMCRLASAAGVKWTREEFHWNWIERKQGEFDFSFFDQLVDTAYENGISVYGLMCYWTEWTGKPMTEEFIEPYCNYLRTVVGRYKGRIRHWEIWNEPNIFFWPGPKELYTKLCVAAYAAIKEVDPEAEVLICSTAGIDTKFIKLVLDEKPPFDALTVHPYRHALDPHGFIKEIQDASAMADGKPVWITEMGWPSNIGGLTEREQAGYVARTYISALAAPATRTVAWYDFREDGVDPFYNEHHFGLVRQDLTPKIGYRALAAVGTLLGGAKFERSVEVGENLIAFEFGEDARRITALWASDRTRLIGLKIEGDHAQLLNMMGEPARTQQDRGLHVVLLEHNLPLYVVSKGEGKIAAKDWPLAIRPERAAYHPGDRVEFALGGLDAMTNLALGRLPAGWQPVKQEGKVEAVDIPASAAPGTYEIEFKVRTMTTFSHVWILPVQVTVAPLLVRG